MQKGRFDEAHVVLARLHASKSEHSSERVAMEFHQMKRKFEQDREVQQGIVWYELFRTTPNRRRVLIAAILMWGNQFTGTLILGNYGVVLFMSLGLSSYVPLLLLATWVTIGLFGNVITALYIDRWGRRKFLLTGVAGILVSLICEYALQARYLGTDNAAGLRAAVFFIFLFIAFWGSCIDATQFVYVTEIFPNHIRSQGSAFSILNTGMSSLVVLLAGPVALERITWRFFIVLIVPTTFYLGAIYCLFPETAKQSLEDINEAFGDKVAVHYHNATELEDQEYDKAVELERRPGSDSRKDNVGTDHVENSSQSV